jgi:histidinol-phosphatase
MAGESLRDLLEFAVELSEKAGEITLKYFQGQLAVETKPDASPVTIADRQTEAYIRETIESRFPQDGLIGEEFGERRPEARRRWIIDPIDGTFSFVHGVPLYGVLIGMEQEDEPLVGVVRLPALNEMAAAARGEGCYWRRERAHVSTTSELGGAAWLTTDLNFDAYPGQSAGLNHLAATAGLARTWGDCYGYVLVATGRVDVMLDPLMHVWDCAPMLPVIEEAGGRFTDWQGQRTIRGGNSVATNGLLHDKVLACL